MRILEVVQLPRPFTVNAKVTMNGHLSVIRTTFFADTLAQAKAIAIQIFGVERLISIQSQVKRSS